MVDAGKVAGDIRFKIIAGSQFPQGFLNIRNRLMCPSVFDAGVSLGNEFFNNPGPDNAYYRLVDNPVFKVRSGDLPSLGFVNGKFPVWAGVVSGGILELLLEPAEIAFQIKLILLLGGIVSLQPANVPVGAV